MRLHNRQLKASFFNDGDLLQWPRDKRYFYAGLIQLADDSACLEDSPFAFKLHIFPSPQDNDLTIDYLAAWRDELIADKKLVAYTSQGKPCLYLMNFHKHQKLKNPSMPEVPLPQWISWISAPSNSKAGKYAINQELLSGFLHPSNNVLTDDLESSYKVLTNNLQDAYECLTNVFQPEPEPEPKRNTDDDDNAHARARPKDSGGDSEVPAQEQAHETNLEESRDPVQALGVRAIAYAEANFGHLLAPAESQDILDWCHEFTGRGSSDAEDIVIQGLMRCIEQNQRKMSYLRGIMIDWVSHNVTKLEHIASRDEEWSAQRERMRSKQESHVNPVRGGKSNAKNIGHTRHDDAGAYDPNAWERAGFAVSGGT